MMVVGENTVSISTIEYEALVESRVKLCIVDRLVRNEKEVFIDGEAIRAVLGIEKKKKVFGNDISKHLMLLFILQAMVRRGKR